LARGGPAAVREAVGAARARVRAAGHRRWVLSSGCALAVGTPAANLDALREAAAVPV
jgi:uroporphyrinogen-III decarboxylase